MNDKTNIWDVYIDSYISDTKIVWAGPHANPLPLNTPIHVVTAHNPFNKVLNNSENKQRNQRLLNDLKQYELEILPVVGHSSSNDWQEDSFALYGLSREQACKIASQYDQRAIFEILDDELLVIEASRLEIKRRRPRNIED